MNFKSETQNYSDSDFITLITKQTHWRTTGQRKWTELNETFRMFENT